MTSVNDSLTNLVSGLGTDRDKTIATSYTVRLLSKVDLDNAYRGDWIARKIVDIPAKDATREWRSWQAEADQITLLEAEEKRLKLQDRVKQGLIKARLYGGSAIVIGVKNATNDQWAKELTPETIKQGGLLYLHTCSRYEISSGPINNDLLSQYFGEPEYYQVSSLTAGMVTVHPSRVVRFVGAEVPDRSLSLNGWGDSIIQAINDAIIHAGLAQGEIASMMQEANVDVIKMPGLMQNVATEAYRSKVMQRYQLAAIGKSINRSLMIDGDEDWQKITNNFSNLPELLKNYLNIAAGAGDIPATRLLGQAPSGLNATGDSDIRNYYDNVGSEQKNVIAPALSRLDEVLIMSALGKRPAEIFYIWKPLWQMTESEKADVMVKKSQAVSNYVNTGLIDSTVMSKAATNMLIEDGSFPGLESALEEFESMQGEEEALNEEDENVQAQFEKVMGEEDEKGNPVTDAAPRPLYVRRDVINTKEILTWANALVEAGIIDESELTKPADMHVTIAYSRTPVDWMKMGENWDQDKDGNVTIAKGGPRLVEPLGGQGAIVLMFSSNALVWRNMGMRERGASWDYEEYQPHITIAYTTKPVSQIDIDSIMPYSGEIKLGTEIFEEIK